MQTKDKLILHHSFWEKRHCIPRKPGFLSSGLILSILTGLPLRIESTRRVRRCKCPVYLRGVELLMVKFYDHVIVIRIFICLFLWNIKYSGTMKNIVFFAISQQLDYWVLQDFLIKIISTECQHPRFRDANTRLIYVLSLTVLPSVHEHWYGRECDYGHVIKSSLRVTNNSKRRNTPIILMNVCALLEAPFPAEPTYSDRLRFVKPCA